MAFDGIVTKSIIKDLNDKLIGGKVNKVYQPEKDEIFLNIRSNRENFTLLLSASSNNPRLYLTDHTKKNPKEAPMFCMILRKHLVGSRILNISQFQMDRIIFIDVASRDELGLDSEKRIILEIMGRHSNIIIIDKSNNKIIDSIKRVSSDISRIRQVLPGLVYELPPLQEKKDPASYNKDEFFLSLDKEDASKPIFKFFYMNYQGLSPLISKEICYISSIKPKTKIKDLNAIQKNNLFLNFSSIMNDVKNNRFFPNIVLDSNNKIVAFHALPINQFNDFDYSKKEYDDISLLLDDYFYKKDNFDRISQKSSSLKKIVNLHLNRAHNKLKYQKKEYDESLNRDIFKVYADLISANIHNIKPGCESINVQNFYDENLNNIDIPMDKKLSPALNAQKYYKKYSKLKNASLLLSKEIPKTKNDILYLENIIIAIDNSTDLDNLEEIRYELIKEGFIKGSNSKNKKNLKQSQPHHYISSDGFDILVGKNNRQNDLLTFKISHREDIWLHIQNMPGSHVIIRSSGQAVPNETLEEAANLAGYYSSGRLSSNLAIDYTERKNVKKPKGAKPGLAIYEDFNTIFINPNIKKINALEKIN